MNKIIRKMENQVDVTELLDQAADQLDEMEGEAPKRWHERYTGTFRERCKKLFVWYHNP